MKWCCALSQRDREIQPLLNNIVELLHQPTTHLRFQFQQQYSLHPLCILFCYLHLHWEGACYIVRNFQMSREQSRSFSNHKWQSIYYLLLLQWAKKLFRTTNPRNRTLTVRNNRNIFIFADIKTTTALSTFHSLKNKNSQLIGTI